MSLRLVDRGAPLLRAGRFFLCMPQAFTAEKSGVDSQHSASQDEYFGPSELFVPYLRMCFRDPKGSPGDASSSHRDALFVLHRDTILPEACSVHVL